MTTKEYKRPVEQLVDNVTRIGRDYVAYGPESDLHNVAIAIPTYFNPVKGIATVYKLNVLSATATPVNVYVNFKTIDPATVAKRFTLLWYTKVANEVNAIATALASIAPSDLTPEQTTAKDLLLTRIESIRKGYDPIIAPVAIPATDPATPATPTDPDLIERSHKVASALFKAESKAPVAEYGPDIEKSFTQVKTALESVPATTQADIDCVDLRDLRGKLNHFGKLVFGRKFSASATFAIDLYRAYFKGFVRDTKKSGKSNKANLTDCELCIQLVNAVTMFMELPDPTPTDPATVPPGKTDRKTPGKTDRKTPGKTDRKTPGKTDPAPLTVTPTDPATPTA